VAAEQHTDIDCPDCGRSCHIEINKREVHSMDGPFELIETVARCRRCRRSFFPSA
jgi:C4-type Zn-finger protein